MNKKGNKKRKIIHGDIKSANILLDENLNVKIADFGLSRLQPLNHTQSTIVTGTLVGTEMYWDPEYATSGQLKVESDVYSFGVVLFELLTGRLAYDPIYIKQNENGLAPIVRQNFEQGTLKDMVDPKLKEESDGYGFTLSKGPNKDSLHIFSKIGYQCLSEKQEKRPKLKVIIKELEKALKLQETHEDGLRISFEDIRLATRNFSMETIIGRGGFGSVYKGVIIHDKEPTPIAVKRLDKWHGQGEQEFLIEVEILFEYKHENIISFVGYCNEKDECISVFEYASFGSLDMHLNNPSLTWTKRLKIGIDVATGLDFLHGGGSAQASVIHRDIKSANILLTGDWRAKISDFGLSIITAIDDEMDFEFEEVGGTVGYIDPLYSMQGFLTRESDIYSLGVVLFRLCAEDSPCFMITMRMNI
ncbi:putative serine/threonine-protein kinase PBL25 isoform X1 [Bidens hawaiensis]|uniref:putative serine/threonine-protein kinase PBL25 isoform X1 n=1 Tax=Bidens hawaiensis TaxID=980011 RepID=UPI00404A113E